MTPTGMDQLLPPADQVVAPPIETYAPPTSPIPRPAPAWRTIVSTRQRRLWTAALAAALLVTAGGIGLLYADDTNNQATIRDLQTRNESLDGRNQNLNDQLKVTEGQLQVSRQQVTDLSTELQHPTLGVWNVPQTIQGPSEYLSSTVPDTFTFHLKLTSNAPMDVSILSTPQFKDAVLCVDRGVANTDYCMHHSGSTWGVLGVRSVNYDFTLARGCAAYLAIITAPGPVTITPNVSVTYDPAASATGACK
ncbi:MAG TPA: hypothetical protein VJT78_11880 [Candidatus Dormibacteraeota bacterium]|nr:hypothetical protein [Candidatus Dormibacteraeota bacterium]